MCAYLLEDFTNENMLNYANIKAPSTLYVYACEF